MKSTKTCPRCRSQRVHRSHRRGALDRVLFALGAELRRCYNCRLRCARVGPLNIPIGESNQRWAGLAVMSSGFGVCLFLVWWVIRRFTELSG